MQFCYVPRSIYCERQQFANSYTIVIIPHWGGRPLFSLHSNNSLSGEPANAADAIETKELNAFSSSKSDEPVNFIAHHEVVETQKSFLLLLLLNFHFSFCIILRCVQFLYSSVFFLYVIVLLYLFLTSRRMQRN